MKLKVAVVSEEDLKPDDDTCVVCRTVDEIPEPTAPGTTKVKCICGVDLWVAASSPKTVQKLCWPCVKKILDRTGEEVMLAVTPEQIASHKRRSMN